MWLDVVWCTCLSLLYSGKVWHSYVFLDVVDV